MDIFIPHFFPWPHESLQRAYLVPAMKEKVASELINEA